MICMCVDPGTYFAGVVIYDTLANEVTNHYGLRMRENYHPVQRLEQFRKALKQVAQAHGVHKIYHEDLLRGPANKCTYEWLTQRAGLITKLHEVAHALKMPEPTPVAIGTIKKRLAHGKADKSEMVEAVKKRYCPSLVELYGKKNAEDVADAFGIALYIAQEVEKHTDMTVKGEQNVSNH